ncbi:MAG: WbqC family protein [Bacteroidales bacterium]|nr:WbqC family protein [Bacteroidales bacterium]
MLLKLFKIKTESKFTEDYEHTYPDKSDLRTILQKKKGHLLATIPYTQVFGEKFPFTPNLSIIDLLFNCGGDQQYLEKIHSQSNI